MNRRSLWFVVLLAGVVLQGAASGAQRRSDAGQTPPKSPQAWTFEEAVEALQYSPDDAYLQYVVLQLARNENKAAEATAQIERRPIRRGRSAERRTDLFDLFTGAAAVQESLQLDTMRGRTADWLGDANDPSKNTVKVASLVGPTIKSHPWGKMLAAQNLGGKKPEVSPLALCVPEDQLYVEFRTLSKLLEIVETADLWGDHFYNQAAHASQTQGASDRLKRQLAIQTDPLTRPFYDMVVNEVALTGNDLYFREGTDITILFEVKQPEVFRMRMDGYLDAAAKSRADAVRSSGKIGAVEYASVATPDRAVSAFSAYPRPNLHVRSNSKAALARVLGAIDGKQSAPRLGESTEFKYIRTLMVRGDKREDGFIYLSDPFIRRLVGPEIKLTERRRLLCYNHLRMIGHSAVLYRTQYGRQPKSLEELVEGGCAPAPFAAEAPARSGKDALYCPCGGKYSLSADGASGVCSYHGHAQQMVPCLEIPQDRVTDREAQEYRQFIMEYSRYWRQYFDPIAIRVQVGPKQYRAETIILPLIDNSIYTGMAQALGGEPEALDAMPVPPRNVFSVVLRLNKDNLLRQFKPEHFFRNLEWAGVKERPDPATVRDFLARGVGNQVGLHMYDASPFFDLNAPAFMGEMIGNFSRSQGRLRDEMFFGTFLVASLNAPVYAAVPVKDAQIVDKFLGELDDVLAALARQAGGGGFLGMKYDFYKIPVPGSDARIRCFSIGLENIVKWRLFYARLDDGLYIASKQFVLDDLAAMHKAGGKSAAEGSSAHAMARVRADRWKEVLPDYKLGWEENARKACLNNLGPLGSVARALSAGGKGAVKSEAICREADSLHAVHFFCPDGGRYEVSADGRHVTCSVHGSAAAPRQLAAPAPGSPTGRVMKEFAGATAELTFLDDGLHAVITVERK